MVIQHYLRYQRNMPGHSPEKINALRSGLWLRGIAAGLTDRRLKYRPEE